MDAHLLFFTDSSADRHSEARGDEAALRKLRESESARYLLIRRGRVKTEPGKPLRIAWQRRSDLEAQGVDLMSTVFLGLLGGQPHFAVIPEEAPLTAHDRFISNTDDAEYVGLRRAAALMKPSEAQMAGHAVHLSNWINRCRYCGYCKTSMRLLEGGHKLLCETCQREEFPRTDPVVMALVTYGDRCLLARQPRFPAGFYAPLAGFVEPSETLEAAVAREVREEVGLEVSTQRYVASQPWPFPTSLMVGYLVEVTSDRLVLDGKELEDGRWFDKTEVARLCNTIANRETSAIFVPPPGVIGRQLIDEWLREPR